MPKEYHEVLQLMAARYPEIQKRGEGVYVHETHSPARSFEQLMHFENSARCTFQFLFAARA